MLMVVARRHKSWQGSVAVQIRRQKKNRDRQDQGESGLLYKAALVTCVGVAGERFQQQVGRKGAQHNPNSRQPQRAAQTVEVVHQEARNKGNAADHADNKRPAPEAFQKSWVSGLADCHDAAIIARMKRKLNSPAASLYTDLILAAEKYIQDQTQRIDLLIRAHAGTVLVFVVWIELDFFPRWERLPLRL